MAIARKEDKPEVVTILLKKLEEEEEEELEVEVELEDDAG